jgi:ABC-type transport system involved in cytochrome bd biosynthesis fused ATPase/permease subunit
VIRKFQLLINFLMASTLISTFVYAASHSLPPVQVSMLVFLALTGLEGTLAWYPNLFNSGKLQLAKEKLAEIPNEPEKAGDQVTFGEVVASNYSAYWSAPTITPVSFKLNVGKALVLRGASGAGKTTSAMGILGLIRYSGSLTINGVEVSNINNLPELVSGALQNGHIFNTSLRENLKISGAEDFTEVLQLLELDKLVAELPDGLDTIIGEYGRGLSGGEAKRVVLARTLLSKAPLLVLDEPTEHLDTELAERITGRILDKYRDRALLVITHSGWQGVPQLNLQP